MQTRSKSKSAADILTPSGIDRIQRIPQSEDTSHEIRTIPDFKIASVSARPSSTSMHSSISQRSQSSHSSATIRAKKLAVEAEHLQRRAELAQQQAEREAERERKLARLQLEAEQMKLQADLAALDASDKSAHSKTSSRRTSHGSDILTEQWVMNNNTHLSEVHIPLPHGVPTTTLSSQHILSQSVPPVISVPVAAPPHSSVNLPLQDTLPRTTNEATTIPLQTTSPKSFHPTHVVQSPSNDNCANLISQLTKAIIASSERPRRPELLPFSGELCQWMPFKSSYDKTKDFFSPAENLVRLNNAIRGPAYHAVASHLWDSSDPEHVMRTLEQSFARPELLVAREIAGLRNIKISNTEHLNYLANTLRNCVSTIKYLRQYECLYSPELFRSILSKLSEHTRNRFTDYAATYAVPHDHNTSRLEILSEFLLVEADRQLKFNFTYDAITNSSTNKPIFFRPLVKETVHATAAKDNTLSSQCLYCKQGPHTIFKCKAFCLLTTESRWQWVRESKICYRCLKANPHRWNFCRAKPCGNNGCTRRHHSLLHGTPETQSQPSTSSVPPGIVATTKLQESDAKPNIQVANISETCVNATGLPQSTPQMRGLLKVLPVVLEGPAGQVVTTALLDEGSTATLIDGDVAARIGAKANCTDHLRIEGVGGMSKDVDVSYVNFYIRGHNLNDRYLIENARAITPLGLRSQNYAKINYSDYQHLAGLFPDTSYEHINPTVLIGAADWNLSLSREVRIGKKNEPVASRTLLGWVLHGAFSSVSKPIDFINFTSDDSRDASLSSQRQYDELERLIKEHFEIDSIGISKKQPRQSAEDQRAVEIIEASAQRLSTGRYEVALPWRIDIPKSLPDSYPQALSRFKLLERQFLKDEAFKISYEAFISGIIQKDYAEECTPDTYHDITHRNEDNSYIRWYLPTFGVMHPQKRKLRVVHDAAAKTRGTCLNNLLLKGPDLLQPLLDILFRFREGPIALNADIREMFPQIKISPKDRDAQRFLWRDKQGALKEYRMSSNIFGAISSPFIALAIKNKNAEEFKAQFPEAHQAIINDHYMDDYLGSHFNVTHAAKIASDIITVHKQCCFEMRSWVSNCTDALNLIPNDLRSDGGSDVSLPPNDNVGVLGVKWNPCEDHLSFRVIQRDRDVVWTKRYILSSVMKIYDPLGLLMPIIIQGRIILQRLWREGLNWDTPLPTKYVSECEEWFDLLDTASNISIPRWYMKKSNPVDIQLHLLADGGEQAYACVAYWRFTFLDASVSLALIGSKARVAPLKPVSIPRLELQAALIASRLAQTILNAHRIKPSAVFYWTDSTTVLKWIRSDARTFKPFVAHRLGEILETTNPSSWRWVPTSLNNADDATKPKVIKISLSHRWFSGPSFLLQPDCNWPVEPDYDMKEVTPVTDVTSELVGLLVDVPLPNLIVPDFSRFSKWLRLLRTTARVLQAARIFRSTISRPITQNSNFSTDETTSPLDLLASDIVLAETLLLQRSQIDTFPEEWKTLHSSQTVSKTSRIAVLSPVLDNDGLIRLDSRIKSAPEISESVKSPLVLDGRHHIVRLMILHYHVQMAHSFNELVLNELRQRFWILRARGTIRSVSNTCQECKRHKVRPNIPQTGDLPLERLDHHKRPFTNVGLDYFGPIEITVHRRHEKRYVALYTCLVTRALHLEVVASLSSDSALLSLRRFIARRGSPAVIMSDNGTNFVGANRILRALHGDDVRDFATNHKIQWRYIPPASPFMGGAWERLVRTVKTALRHTLKSKTPKEEILTTLLLEAEAIINSRPLSYSPSSPQIPESITPFHFILGTSSTAPWTASLTDADLSRRSDWRHTLRLADHFWARWLREYLPTLRPRGRRGSQLTFSEGDVVLIADSSLPRGLWPLGRVTKVFRGADGMVRVADVQTKGGILRRPVRKLLLIEADNQTVSTECC